MEHLLNQRLTTSQKNKEWRESMVDYHVELSFLWYGEWQRIEENYALKNNQMNREEIATICKGLGTEEHADLFINAYNKTHNIIDAHKGEEWNRPFSFGIVNNSKKAIDKIDRDKRREIDKVAEDIFKLEMNRQQELYAIEEKRIKGSMDEQQAGKAVEQLQNRYNKLYGAITDPKTIFDKYENITTAEEVAIDRIMKMMIDRQNIKFVKNQTFEDAIIAGREAVEVYSLHEGDLPRIRQLNPLNLFFQKSPDVMWIQDADYAGYRELLTIERVIEEYGEFLSDAEYTKLVDTGPMGNIKGLNHPFSVDSKHKMPSEDREVRNFKSIPRHDHQISTEDYIVQSALYGGPDNGYIGSEYRNRLGLSATDSRRNRLRAYIDVYTIYWKSQRKLGKYSFINDYGELESTFVDESFLVPKNAVKETIATGYTKSKVVYNWSDPTDSNQAYSLEWLWVPEVWKGIRIGQDIYCQIEPVKHAYQSLLNPYEVKLPIYGYIYNNRNAYSISLMDRMKPWQKLYYVIMARMLKLLSQDRGVLTFININMLDKSLGFKEALRVAEDNGIVPYNPASNNKGLGNPNTAKIAESIDATNAGAIQHYIRLLEFVEQNIKLASGMSDQRLAQTNARMTATDNYRDTMHSINITEPLHAAHDLLWQEILQGMMEMTLSILSESTGKIRGFLNDEEKVLIDLDLLSLEDNFRLRVADNSKAYKILEQAKQLSHALVQNDKASLDTLIELMETENLSEFKHLVRAAEDKFQQRQEDQQKGQQEHEKEMAELARKQSEDAQISKLDEIWLKGKLEYDKEMMKAELQAASFDAEKDYNKDGIADYLQLEQFKQKIAQEDRKLSLQEFKLAMDQRKLELEHENKNIDKVREDQKDEMDRVDKKLELEQKARLEQAKLKIMKNKAKS